ncbi:hypothetical protein ACNJYD_07900 [Bradyrhizobium sp. DASA03005]|uniref:hypothetical protein n=1 Tax=Bradyrhizobium sp. SPXBL-02 TaxID=3395912 RepID=UPI003F7181A1
MPLVKFFGLLATCRVSLGLYNTREEIDVLLHALIKVCRVTGERTRGKAARVELCSFGSCTSSSSRQVSIFNFSKLKALVSLCRPAGLAADFRLQSQSTAVADRLQNRVGEFQAEPALFHFERGHTKSSLRKRHVGFATTPFSPHEAR